MDTRKITLIATIAVIALIAVGVGYAYTASTQNSDNSAKSEYVTLTQVQTTGSASGAYKFANDARVYFDSVNTSSGTTYTLSGVKDTTTFDGYAVVQVGNPFDLVATQTNGSYGDLTCKISATSGFTNYEKWFYFLKIDDGTKTVKIKSTGLNAWEDKVFKIVKNGGESEYKKSTVTVYFGYSTSNVPNTVPASTIITGASLTFTAYNTSINNPGIEVDYERTGTNLTGDVTVSYNGNELTVGTHYKLIWRDSNGVAVPTSTTATGTYTLEVEGMGDYIGVYDTSVTDTLA